MAIRQRPYPQGRTNYQGCFTFKDLKSFKIYHLDIGLLRVMSELSPQTITESTRIFEESKGALTEQFALQEMSAFSRMRSIYYWTSDATAEVDFVFSDGQKVIPVEVKSSGNIKAQSLKLFRSKYDTPLGVRTALTNISFDYSLLNIPLYVLWNFQNYSAQLELFYSNH